MTSATRAGSETLASSGIKNENKKKKKLAAELHKPFIRICKKRKVHSSFIDNIWGAEKK